MLHYFNRYCKNLFQDHDFCLTCTSLSNGVFLSALSTSPAADGDCKRWEAKRDGKKPIRPEEETEIPSPLAHFDLLYRTIYIKPKHHVYIFFSASLSLSPLLLFSVGSPLLPPLHAVFFLYPQGAGCMHKHRGSLSFKWPSLKIAPFFYFFFSTELFLFLFLKALRGTCGLIWCCNSCLGIRCVRWWISFCCIIHVKWLIRLCRWLFGLYGHLKLTVFSVVISFWRKSSPTLIIYNVWNLSIDECKAHLRQISFLIM